MKVSKTKVSLWVIALVVIFTLIKCGCSSDEKPIKKIKNNTQKPFFSRFLDKDGSPIKNKIHSVTSYKDAFPDENDVQLEAAMANGITPKANDFSTKKGKEGMVYVGSNPYFHVDKLSSSVPYLVPRAAVLLQDIGSNFYDSLQIKGLPLQQIIVTSITRSKEDVDKLRTKNLNAKQNSGHLYGTTFDISYNRYNVVQLSAEDKRRAVRNDTLKWVLSEVLRDIHTQKRCYIKYEVKQGCFHITVR